MYVLKIDNDNFKKLIKSEHKTKTDLAKEIGVHRTYISHITSGKDISKLCAYAVCKAISPNLEIEDIFEIKKS